MQNIYLFFEKIFLTVLYSGTVKNAPGTVGSIVSFILIMWMIFWLHMSTYQLWLCVGIVTIIWWMMIHQYEKRTGKHDTQSIVIDEFVWVWVMTLIVMTVTDNILFLILGLITFRIFDIYKPGVIWYVDTHVSWALWVMLDDILAGICAWWVIVFLYFAEQTLWYENFITISVSVMIAVSVYYISIALVKNPKTNTYIKNHAWLHPNSISFIRLPLACIAISLYHFWYRDAGIWLYVFTAILDATDGIFARWVWLVSTFGKSLDPFIDKLTYFIPLIYFALQGNISPVLVFIFIIIDTAGQFSRVILKKYNIPTQANIFGKLKTTFVFLFIFYLMLALPNESLEKNNIAIIIAILFALFSIVFKAIPLKK